MVRSILAAASLGAALAAVPAVAGTKAESSMTVQFEDLDLTTSEGRAELDQRITLAARRACGVGRHTTGTRSISRDQRRCIANVEKQAKTEIAALMGDQQLGG